MPNITVIHQGVIIVGHFETSQFVTLPTGGAAKNFIQMHNYISLAVQTRKTLCSSCKFCQGFC